MIDLSQFVTDREVLVPIVGDKFQFEGKKYKVKSTEDSWYKCILNGNKAKIIEPLYNFFELEKCHKPVKGYSYNNSIIFHNFDSAKRKWKFQISKNLLFNKSQSFSAIKAIVWEDLQVYFTEPDYSNFKIFEIKTAFDEKNNLDNLKGITPELRTLYLFHSIERDQLREMERIHVEELEVEERLEQERRIMATVRGRLQITFSRAGARLINYTISGKRITVDWEIIGFRHQYNSVIDADTFKIIEAGYCMSGEDRKHNITSMVKLAEGYDEDGLIYITRN